MVLVVVAAAAAAAAAVVVVVVVVVVGVGVVLVLTIEAIERVVVRSPESSHCDDATFTKAIGASASASLKE